MLPPKKSLATAGTPMSSSAGARPRGARGHRAPYVAREDRTGRPVRRRPGPVGQPRRRGSPRPARRRPRRRTRGGPRGRRRPPGEGRHEARHHADAVLVLGVALVVRAGGTAAPPAGSTRRPRRPGAGEGRVEQPCQTGDGVEDVLGLAEGVGRMSLVGERLSPAGPPHARQARVAVEDPGQRVVRGVAVVDPRADHDLAVHLNAAVEQDLEPAQAGGALRVAQHGAAARGRWRGSTRTAGPGAPSGSARRRAR